MSYQLHRISVLVVEDNEPMLDIVKSLLLTFGVGHVVGAPDGELGFKRFCEYNPDIVIADWMMKPMDGMTFTRMIRNDERSPNHYVPVILMTGFSEKRRVLQARDAGVTEFLVKPFDARDLYKRIAQVIERPRQFVRSVDFFGPDRRRKRDAERFGAYGGPMRREGDMAEANKNRLIDQQTEAYESLRKIREKNGLAKGDKFDINPNDIDFA
jgi:two-component system chemotaxis response regulator CheY